LAVEVGFFASEVAKISKFAERKGFFIACRLWKVNTRVCIKVTNDVYYLPVKMGVAAKF
jgi:hypothetical protein